MSTLGKVVLIITAVIVIALDILFWNIGLHGEEKTTKESDFSVNEFKCFVISSNSQPIHLKAYRTEYFELIEKTPNTKEVFSAKKIDGIYSVDIPVKAMSQYTCNSGRINCFLSSSSEFTYYIQPFQSTPTILLMAIFSAFIILVVWFTIGLIVR